MGTAGANDFILALVGMKDSPAISHLRSAKIKSVVRLSPSSVSYWLRSAETFDPFDIESFFKSAPAKQHTSLAAYEQIRIGKGTNRNQKGLYRACDLFTLRFVLKRPIDQRLKMLCHY
jgi:hypothetical protein